MQIRCFYRFIVNLHFASVAFFAAVILSCIRYPAVPVCKKCAKMCRAKISPFKQALSFYAKPEKRPGSSPIRQLQSCLFRLSIKCTSTTTIHGRDLDNRTDTTLYRKNVSYEQTAFLPLQHGHQPGGSPICGRLCRCHRLRRPSRTSTANTPAQRGRT